MPYHNESSPRISAKSAHHTDGKPNPSDIVIDKYGRSRFWAIWLDGELLAVTVYKKGAIAVQQALLRR